jgi:hypothetical protein
VLPNLTKDPRHFNPFASIAPVGQMNYAARRIARRYNVAMPLARVVAELVYAVEARS